MFLLANRVAAAAAGGPAGVALLEAPRLLVAPLQVVGASAGNLTTPRAARAFARGGRGALLHFITPVAATWTVVFAAYAAVVAAAPGFWLRLVYGGKYAGAETILVLWCATYALTGTRVVPASALRVTRNNAAVMWAAVAAGATVLAATAVLAAWLGVTGAAIGRLVGEITLVVLVAVAFFRRVAGRERSS
jgi:O-antigen/teichoic acid export membrane protein